MRPSGLAYRDFAASASRTLAISRDGNGIAVRDPGTGSCVHVSPMPGIGDGILLTGLKSVHMGRGYASRLLSAILAIADTHGVSVHLKPEPFGPGGGRLELPELTAFYGRHGFEFIPDGTMSRIPGGPEPPIEPTRGP